MHHVWLTVKTADFFLRSCSLHWLYSFKITHSAMKSKIIFVFQVSPILYSPVTHCARGNWCVLPHFFHKDYPLFKYTLIEA